MYSTDTTMGQACELVLYEKGDLVAITACVDVWLFLVQHERMCGSRVASPCTHSTGSCLCILLCNSSCTVELF